MKTSTGLVVALLVCALAGMGVLGCNTFRGAGKDIQKGGRAIEKAANDTQNESPRSNTITAWAEPGGWISPAGSTVVSHRSGRTFIVRPFRGYHVADVLVDGRSVGAVSRHTFNNVTADHTISALFTVNPS
jgi:predicted small secreted protein